MQQNDVTTDTDKAIAGAVRAEVARRRVRQQELLDKTGWSRSYLNRRLHGRVAISAAELLALAVALGVDVSALIPADTAPLPHLSDAPAA